MSRFSMLVRRLVKDEEAATMIEYALMVALIAIVCVVAVQGVATNLGLQFNAIAAALPAA